VSATQTSSDVFSSPVNLYTTVNYKTDIVGGFASYTPGPTVSTFGFGVGLAFRPFAKLDRLALPAGARIGQKNPPTEGARRSC
jgi:hypothetical protein